MSENDVETDNKAVEEEDTANPTTPFYNQPEDADRYPVALPSPIPAHTVFKGNPQIDGPYLDDIREAQADARREANDRVSEIQREKAKEAQQALENLKKANDLVTESAPEGEEDVPEDKNEDTPEDETPSYSGGFTGNNE
jgi:hypothetical protein